MATYTIGDKVKIKAGEGAGKSGVVCATKGMSAFVRAEGEDGTSAALVAFADLEPDGAADDTISEEATMADAGEADEPSMISRSFRLDHVVVNAEQGEPTAANGTHNDAFLIQRELDKFTDYVVKLERAGKIDKKTADRQLDAAYEVEDCFPTNNYMPIKWTQKGVMNLRAIREFNRKHAINSSTAENAEGDVVLPFNAETDAECVACNGNPKVAEKWLHDEIKRTTWEDCRVKINGSEYTVEVQNGLEENAKFVSVVRAAVVKLVDSISRATKQVGKIKTMQASGGKIVFKTTIDIASTNACHFSSNPVVNAAMQERAANAGGKE